MGIVSRFKAAQVLRLEMTVIREDVPGDVSYALFADGEPLVRGTVEFPPAREKAVVDFGNLVATLLASAIHELAETSGRSPVDALLSEGADIADVLPAMMATLHSDE